jgi:hypothetical protein
MLPLKPQFLVSAATALAAWNGQREPQDAEDDRATTDASRTVASVRFVHFAGFWSHFTPETNCSSWPFTGAEGIEGLADLAEQHGGLESTPAPGDVFLLASFGDRHVRAGVVVTLEMASTMLDGSLDFVCITIEGEVAIEGSESAENADPVFITARLVRRRLSPGLGDRFIRWCRLSPLELPASVEYESAEDVVQFHRPRRSKILVRLERALRAPTR